MGRRGTTGGNRMPPQEIGATEWLANLSVGYVVLAALVLTVVRLALIRSRAPAARSVAELAESLLVAGVLVFLIIRPFFLQAFYIPSPSMEPTLLGHDAGDDFRTNTHYTDTVHDHIFVNKLIYRLRMPQHGDIIVFRAPKEADFENGQRYENVLIKRLIGLPGDTIEVKPDAGGVMRVWRNGKPLHEPYLAEEMDSVQPDNARYGVGEPLKLGPGQLFVMGDNRNHSNDSRFWGPLALNRVMGKAMFIFWPPGRIRILH